MEAAELLQSLEQAGIARVSNSLTAGRMPPEVSKAMYPVEFYGVYHTDGRLTKNLGDQLGPPLPAPKMAFNMASGSDADSPSPSAPGLNRFNMTGF